MRDSWAEFYNLITDRSEEINLKKQMPVLYEKLHEEHEARRKNKLQVKPMWPRIMDERFVIEGKDYYFPRCLDETHDLFVCIVRRS
ncbi:MAG: hypothetical protein ACN4G0_19160 [Polyangiales bacterium]